MAVSPFPYIFLALLILWPVIGALAFRRTRRGAILGGLGGLALSVVLLFATVGFPLIRGTRLRCEALAGSPEAQFEYARWIENGPATLGMVIPWDEAPDVAAGYDWLARAANGNHPEALYALGVRIKLGMFTPPNWTASVPDVPRGQALIDKAIRLGYRPKIEEDFYYWKVYRGR